MVKKSLPNNENNRLYNSVTLRQVELPLTGINEFFSFNFCRSRGINKNKQLISPHNLCKKVELKLEQLCIKQNWNTPGDIISSLNFPKDNRFKFSPLNFKYVYDYVVEYKTQHYFDYLDVPEEILIRPVDSSFQEFYSI